LRGDLDAGGIAVGILIPSHRNLSHVTRQFLERITRRLKQLEIAASD
jgi:hypothetical protein